LAPVEEGVLLLDPVASSNYRSSKEHFQRVAQAMQTPVGIDRMNQVIDLFTFDPNVVGTTGTHSDGMVVQDKLGNTISMVHTSNAQPFGSGIFVQGIMLPDSLSGHAGFLQGPFNNRSESVMLTECLQHRYGKRRSPKDSCERDWPASSRYYSLGAPFEWLGT
jgi:hypothetical protein